MVNGLILVMAKGSISCATSPKNGIGLDMRDLLRIPNHLAWKFFFPMGHGLSAFYAKILLGSTEASGDRNLTKD